jgi:hypothetical protein
LLLLDWWLLWLGWFLFHHYFLLLVFVLLLLFFLGLGFILRRVNYQPRRDEFGVGDIQVTVEEHGLLESREI